MKVPLFAVFTAAVCFSACDAIAPDKPTTNTITMMSGLRVTLSIEPGAVDPGQAFNAVFSITNPTNHDIVISSQTHSTSGDLAMSPNAQTIITKDGVPADNHFSTFSACSFFIGTLSANRAVITLHAGEQLVTCGTSLTATPFFGPDAPRGDYLITVNFPSWHVDSPAPEDIPSISAKVHIRD